MKCHFELIQFLLGGLLLFSFLTPGDGFFFHLFRKGRSHKRPYSGHGRPLYRPQPSGGHSQASSSSSSESSFNNVHQSNHHVHTSSCGWKPYYGPQYHEQKPVTVASLSLPAIQVHPTRRPYSPSYPSNRPHLTTTLRPKNPNGIFVSYSSSNSGASSSTTHQSQFSQVNVIQSASARPPTQDPFASLDGYGPPDYQPPPPVVSSSYSSVSPSSFGGDLYFQVDPTHSPISNGESNLSYSSNSVSNNKPLSTSSSSFQNSNDHVNFPEKQVFSTNANGGSSSFSTIGGHVNGGVSANTNGGSSSFSSYGGQANGGISIKSGAPNVPSLNSISYGTSKLNIGSPGIKSGGSSNSFDKPIVNNGLSSTFSSGSSSVFNNGGGSLNKFNTGSSNAFSSGSQILSNGGSLNNFNTGTSGLSSGGSSSTRIKSSGGTKIIENGGSFNNLQTGTVPSGNGGSINLFNSGTVPSGNGGSINSFNSGTGPSGNGGSINLFSSGTVPSGNGGSINLFSSGTGPSGNGGSIKSFNSGTGAYKNGDSINLFSSGTDASGNGGSIKSFNSGTVASGNDGSIKSFNSGTGAILHEGSFNSQSNGRVPFNSGGSSSKLSGGSFAPSNTFSSGLNGLRSSGGSSNGGASGSSTFGGGDRTSLSGSSSVSKQNGGSIFSTPSNALSGSSPDENLSDDPFAPKLNSYYFGKNRGGGGRNPSTPSGSSTSFSKPSNNVEDTKIETKAPELPGVPLQDRRRPSSNTNKGNNSFSNSNIGGFDSFVGNTAASNFKDEKENTDSFNDGDDYNNKDTSKTNPSKQTSAQTNQKSISSNQNRLSRPLLPKSESFPGNSQTTQSTNNRLSTTTAYPFIQLNPITTESITDSNEESTGSIQAFGNGIQRPESNQQPPSRVPTPNKVSGTDDSSSIQSAIAPPTGYGPPSFNPPAPLSTLPDIVTDPPLVVIPTQFPALPTTETEKKSSETTATSVSTTTTTTKESSGSTMRVIDGESSPVSLNDSSSTEVNEEKVYTTKPNQETTLTAATTQASTIPIEESTNSSTEDGLTTGTTVSNPTTESKVEKARKAKDFDYPRGIVSQIDGSSNWPWSSPSEATTASQEEPDVHTLTTTADLSGKWFRRPSEGGLRTAKEFEALTSFLNNSTSIDENDFSLNEDEDDEEQSSLNRVQEPSKKASSPSSESNTTFKPDNLVVFYPLNGKPFLSFVPKVEFADISSIS